MKTLNLWIKMGYKSSCTVHFWKYIDRALIFIFILQNKGKKLCLKYLKVDNGIVLHKIKHTNTSMLKRKFKLHLAAQLHFIAI